MQSQLTKRRMEERVQSLIEHFSEYVDLFYQKNLFTGPSVYFHNKTLEILKGYDQAILVLNDEKFFDYLYATLTAWGLHRMGPGPTKLIDIRDLMDSIQDQKKEIQFLQSLNIDEIPDQNVPLITSRIWALISNIRVSEAKTKIVAGSKALHHILPQLIPPIDREYTLMFFYGHKTLNRGDEIAFKEMYPYFYQISKACKNEIQAFIGMGNMNTSKTKIIDNAIVGYVLTEIKSQLNTN
jgi:hypothetical protein